MIFAQHAQFVTSVVTNPRFFEGLPSEKQAMIRKTIAELNEYIFAVQEKYNAKRLEQIREKKPGLKIIHLTAEEREAFRKASLPVRQQYIEMVGPTGKALLDTFLREIAKAEEAM
jgi:TRAP-type C4-dicarboxylate transport system substrate-binding protein